MRFVISHTSGQPVYLQLVQQIRHAIETGVLRPGDALPGLRSLAQDLVVSPNTIVKAYDVLEHDKWIDVRPGSGAYVAARADVTPRVDRLRHAHGRVRALVGRLRAEGFSDEEIQRLFEGVLVFSDLALDRSKR
jgi:GntR family transcriptional regulator